MKRNLAILVSAVLSASMFVGSSAVYAEETPAAENGTEKMKIAFIPQLIGIPYFTAMEIGGNAAAEDLGVEYLNVGSPTANAVEQVKIMDSLIRQGVDAVSISVLDTESINPYIDQAKEAGILAYTSDSDAPNSNREFFVCQAMADDMGRTLIDELVKQTGEEAQIGFVSGESTASNLNAWIDAMKARVDEKYPNIEIVDVRYTTDGSTEDALKQTQEMMIKFPELKGVVGVATSVVPGLAQAVQQAGKAGEISVIGVASPNVVRPYIEAGVMKCSVLWNAVDLGYLTVWAAHHWITEGSFETEFKLDAIDNTIQWIEDERTLLLGDPLVIDADNVDDFDF